MQTSGNLTRSRTAGDWLAAARRYEREGELYAIAIEQLQSAGYEQYEISNFARPGHRCAHNLNYWQNGEYAGLGVGAAIASGGGYYAPPPAYYGPPPAYYAPPPGYYTPPPPAVYYGY